MASRTSLRWRPQATYKPNPGEWELSGPVMRTTPPIQQFLHRALLTTHCAAHWSTHCSTHCSPIGIREALSQPQIPPQADSSAQESAAASAFQCNCPRWEPTPQNRGHNLKCRVWPLSESAALGRSSVLGPATNELGAAIAVAVADLAGQVVLPCALASRP